MGERGEEGGFTKRVEGLLSRNIMLDRDRTRENDHLNLTQV